jgi:hypothetical protein
MDPEVALAKARDALARFRAADAADGDPTAAYLDAGADLADAFEALDNWMSQGGFPPPGWNFAGPGAR